MKRGDLEEYEERERSYVRSVGHRAMLGDFVGNASEIYANVRKSRRRAFHRSGSPLSALLLLYQQTVVYIPPASKKLIESRLGLKWDDLLELAERGCLQPVIGHPTHYAKKGHFDELLELGPPSVWARGDELARGFAGADEYWDIARALLPLEAMVQVPWLRQKYAAHFPRLGAQDLSERIEIELCTNFVDLCIYGYEPLARDLGALPDHDWSTRRILEVSELLTYPTLMGMGGTPNYGLSTDGAVRVAERHQYLGRVQYRELGVEAPILLEGLSISVPDQMGPSDVVQFHKDGMADHLWKALSALEHEVVVAQKESMGGLLDAAATAQEIVQQTLREVRGVVYGSERSRIHQSILPQVDLTMKVGSAVALTLAAHGPLGLDWTSAILGGTGAAGTLWAIKKFDSATARVEESLAERIASRGSSRLASQLWWLSGWKKGA